MPAWWFEVIIRVPIDFDKIKKVTEETIKSILNQQEPDYDEQEDGLDPEEMAKELASLLLGGGR